MKFFFLNKYNSNSFVQFRNKIILNENAQVKIVENIQNLSENLCFINNVTEISLSKNSNLELNKLQNYSSSQNTIDTTNVNQQEKSASTINTMLFGGAFTRNNLNFFQNGQNCESNMNGIVILSNNELGDNHTYVDHKKRKLRKQRAL